MDIKSYFQFDPGFDLTAAQIGINKWDWIGISISDENEALKIMRTNKFDVLPIIGENGEVNEYYCTREWNKFEALNRCKIDSNKAIYYRTSFPDLIKIFHESKDHYFFLSDYKNILGLVSFVNLNSPNVYNYLYNVLSDIERKFLIILKRYLDEHQILAYYKEANDKHLVNLFNQYTEYQEKGIDHSIFELMYFQSLGITFRHFVNDLPISLRNLNSFAAKMTANGVYNSVRSKIMHPVRAILHSEESITELNELLDDYEVIRSQNFYQNVI